GNSLDLTIQNRVQRRGYLSLKYSRRQGGFLGIRQEKSSSRSGKRLIQAQIVIRVIEPERRIDNGQLNDEFDSGRCVRLEVRAGKHLEAFGNRQIRKIRIWILLLESTKRSRIQSQLRFTNDAVETDVVEQTHTHRASIRMR